jgi:membrane protein
MGFVRRCVRAGAGAAGIFTATAANQRAAAIAYHVLFSLVPFVALFVSVAELLLPESAQERLVAWLVEALPLRGDIEESVEDAVASAGPPATVAGIIALLGLLWTASGMMASIRSAFRAIWDSETGWPYVRGKLLDLVLVAGAGVLVVSAFGLGVVVQIVTHTSSRVVTELWGREASGAALGSLAELAGSLALALLAFLALYRIVPPVRVRLRDALPGAVLAAVGFQLASAGFSLYLAHVADFDEVYGSLGAILAFLVLVYVAATVLLVGACFAAAWPAAGEAVSRTASQEPLRRRLLLAARSLVTRDAAARETESGDDAPPR